MNRLGKIGLIACVLLASCSVAENELNLESPPALFVDVAEVATTDTVQPSDGVSSSAQPDADTFKIFAKSGYRAVIDLRGEGENRGLDEPAVVEALGMSYIPLPIENTQAVNFENAARLKTLIDQQDGPVLIHCGSGNRVGALLALIESQAGADDEAAVAAGKAGGLTRLEPVVRQRISERKQQ